MMKVRLNTRTVGDFMTKNVGWRFGSSRPLAVALAMAILSCCEALALMVPLATTTLVDRAECIVEGRVESVTSRWTEDHSGIVTEVVIDATDVLLGDTNRVTFLYEGGIVGRLEQHVSDMPSLVKGQQVLVFLCPQSAQEAGRDPGRSGSARSYALFGAAQGVCRIEGGRAIKDRFSVLGDASAIDRDVDVNVLKERVRQRLRTTRPERNRQ
jgi:hypothetical protein